MKSKMLSNEMGEEDSHRWKRQNVWYGIIFGLEGVLIAATSAICGSTNYLDLFVLVMAFIVGAYFFPPANLCQVKNYYFSGSLLCLVRQ
jgi:hypothetical protein